MVFQAEVPLFGVTGGGFKAGVRASQGCHDLGMLPVLCTVESLTT